MKAEGKLNNTQILERAEKCKANDTCFISLNPLNGQGCSQWIPFRESAGVEVKVLGRYYIQALGVEVGG